MQQLTSGGQNAEAYWSPDGKQLVFQSTRDGAQCDQIYVMDADGKNVKRISNGTGATTCGYFLPDGKHVLYASTHGAARLVRHAPIDRRATCGRCLLLTTSTSRASTARSQEVDRCRRLRCGSDRQLGAKEIVYTSKASGDLDLWSMKIDGGQKKRLTTDTRLRWRRVLLARWKEDRMAREPSCGRRRSRSLYGTARPGSHRANEDGTVRCELGRIRIPSRSRASGAPVLRLSSHPMENESSSLRTRTNATAGSSSYS